MKTKNQFNLSSTMTVLEESVMNQINGGKAATYQHCGVTACPSPQGNQNYAKVYTSPKAAI